APFSAYLSFPLAAPKMIAETKENGENIVSKLVILSSSPERFLKIGQADVEASSNDLRTVEMKPIKGTVAVAKGCFCGDNEGCSLDIEDQNNSDDDDDDSQGFFDNEVNENNLMSRKFTSKLKDLCAEPRERENQRRINELECNVKERAENLMV